MKSIERLKHEKLTRIDQIQGGKRTKSFDVFGEKIDVKKMDKEGKLKWIKYIH